MIKTLRQSLTISLLIENWWFLELIDTHIQLQGLISQVEILIGFIYQQQIQERALFVILLFQWVARQDYA